ncbi:hypothetical protein Hanom_Chr10g00909211 [Helianthus anomalus]
MKRSKMNIHSETYRCAWTLWLAPLSYLVCMDNSNLGCFKLNTCTFEVKLGTSTWLDRQ